MKTIGDLEERSEAIRERLADIFDELREADGPGRAIDLAEEVALLLREENILQHNIRYHNKVAKRLMSDPCSGPH